MKHPFRFALLAASLLLAGCSSWREATPSQRWGSATIVYSKTTNGMSVLAESGQLSLEAANRFETVRAPVGTALDAAYDDLVAGNDTGADDWLDIAENLIDAMLAAQAEAKEATDGN